MVAKSLIILSLAVAAYAGPLLPGSKVVYAEPEAPAHYDFSYSVHDSHTGDVKQQQESRQGDAVHGSYSLVQPDGVHRIVEYTSDAHNGFNAIVRYEGTPVAAAPAYTHAAPVYTHAAPVYTHAAPAAYAHAAPVAYTHAAPVAKVAYAAPVAKVAYAAPIAKVAYAAPVAKVAYAAAPVAHVTYSSPAISYHH